MDLRLSGTVEDITYKNTESGFCVLDLDAGGELVTVVGELADVCEGETLTVYGEYVTHPTYGPQFKCTAAERVLPRTASAILKYLSGRAIPGIGPVIAKRIVEMFGDSTLEVMAKTPMELAKVRGISTERAKEVGAAFSRIYGMREVITRLSAVGLDTSDAIALYRAFGAVAPDVIGDNPYLLCGRPLYKEWELADGMARSAGMAADAADRITAGYVYVLRHNLQNGHTCIPAEKLINVVANFLQIDRDRAEIALYDIAGTGVLRIAPLSGGDFVFLSDCYYNEKYISERIRLLGQLDFEPPEQIDRLIDDFQTEAGITYAPYQREAIAAALGSGAVIITGGPGTGKTTTVNGIIALCEQQGDRVGLAAPTGRAAKRMSELTGKKARTIHRLLEVDHQAGDELRFIHNEDNPLNFDVCVVDEMSMVDSALFCSLLKGLRPQCRLVLVGDNDQLPAVGAGCVLKDMIESGAVHTVELSTIFRQAAESLIVTNAHRIVGGDLPELDSRDRDFFFLPCEKEKAAELVASLACRRLPKSYGLDPLTGIQVLTPTRIGLLGTQSLNDAIRAVQNPKREGRNEIRVMGATLREGDKVMQVKNNYDIAYTRFDGEQGMGVFNGDIGVITDIRYSDETLMVEFDDRKVEYTFEQAKQLEAAYAITVHKSQGSEYDAVILALGDVSRRLCYRNLLYTAVTRARRILVIVGDRSVIEGMVANGRRSGRYTGLRDFLGQNGPFELLR